MRNFRGFSSDNSSGIHPNVLEWIHKANQNHVMGYGNDPFTERAEQLFKQHFGEQTVPFFVFTGTAANVLGISQLLTSTEAVICAETAHINEHECGALQNFNGCRLLPVQSADGKLTIDLIQSRMDGIDDEHYSQPKLISISQPTELGTLYTAQEIQRLATFAHKHNMFLHLDGARISNAAVALNMKFKEFTVDCGVDLVSFGGTKNGLMMAEAILFFDEMLAKRFEYIHKQGMQLASKMRFIAAQFIAFFEKDLWLKNAHNANYKASQLIVGLKKFSQIKLLHHPSANIVFAQVPGKIISELQSEHPFYVINKAEHIIRLVCSYDTSDFDISNFIKKLEDLLKNN